MLRSKPGLVAVSALAAVLLRQQEDDRGAVFPPPGESREEVGGGGGMKPTRLPVTLAQWLPSFAHRCVTACKAADTVDAAQVERAVDDVALLLDEHIHRLGSKTTAGRTVAVDVSRSTFTATFTAPRGTITADAMVEGVRLAVRSLQSASVSLSKQDTIGDEGRAASVRVRASGVGNLRVDLLQPFDPREDVTMEVEGDLLPGSLELMRGMFGFVCSPEGQAGKRRVDPGQARPVHFNSNNSVLFGGDPAAAMFGNMEDVLRMLMEETRRAGVAMGELDDMMGDGAFSGRMPRQKSGSSLSGSGSGLGRDVARSGSPGSAGSADEAMEQLVKTLEERGIRTYLPAKDDGDSGGPGEKDSTHVDWRGLAGYESQKRQIEENLLLPLRRPEVFDDIARKTRTHYASNRPRALLFTGPPGTGKTSSARVISRAAGVPLCYVPLEAIASKWYGESEKKLAEALEMIDSGFPNGAVIFIDELDSLATTRGNDMHEATRRMLGVLLRYLDGFDQNKRAVVVGATNVPGDLVGIETDLHAPTDSQTLRLSHSCCARSTLAGPGPSLAILGQHRVWVARRAVPG